MSEETVIGRKFAIVIPKRIREGLKIKEGQRVLVRREGDVLMVEPLPMDPDAVLNKVLRNFEYDEEKHERVAEEWLIRAAGRRYRGSIRSQVGRQAPRRR